MVGRLSQPIFRSSYTARLPCWLYRLSGWLRWIKWAKRYRAIMALGRQSYLTKAK